MVCRLQPSRARRRKLNVPSKMWSQSPLQMCPTYEKLRQTTANHLGTQCKAREIGRARFDFQGLPGKKAVTKRSQPEVTVKLLTLLIN